MDEWGFCHGQLSLNVQLVERHEKIVKRPFKLEIQLRKKIRQFFFFFFATELFKLKKIC